MSEPVSTSDSEPDRRRAVGRDTRRKDSRGKLTGAAEYPTDLDRPGMLHAGVLRSHRAHARIAHVETDAAAAMDDVVCVRTRAEFLGDFDDRVRHYGDAIAAVAAETPEAVEVALRGIEYELEALEAVHDPAESLRASAPRIHEGVAHRDGVPDYGQPVRHPRNVENPDYERNVDDYHRLLVGDVEAGFEAADHVLEATYETPRVNHCNLDRHCCLADWEGDRLELTETIGNRTHTEHALERLFDDRFDIEILTPPAAGSSFGGHSLETLTLEPVAATLARATDRPVKLAFDREEEFTAGDSRHPTTLTLRAGMTDEGRLTALDVDVVTDTGAYPNGVGHIVLSNCEDRPLDLYRLDNYRFEGVSVFTNNTPSGEYRGIGVTQVTWALESHVDELARQAGLDPIAVREKNWVETGHERPHTGEPVTSCGLRQCLDRGRETAETLRRDEERPGADGDDRLYGWGVASGAHSTTPASEHKTDYTEAKMQAGPDGNVTVAVGAVELGQGAETALAQIAAEETGIDIERVTVRSKTHADGVEDKYGSIASRSTYLMGRAIAAAAAELTGTLCERASEHLTAPAADLTVADGHVRGDGSSVPLEELLPEPLSVTGRAETTHAPSSFGVHFAGVAVDPATGEVDLRTYVAAQDVGYAINPAMVEGQLHGAIQHGVEFAVLSEVQLNRGVPENANLADYPVSSPHEMPEELAVEIVESNEESGPYGAKGVGTPSITPVAPAITNAIRDAVDTRFTAAPIREEDVFFALREDEQ
ncbi:MAG: xanthine dehydrogenase family protein molybdopterin-binding subunit [Halapricum sp.]